MHPVDHYWIFNLSPYIFQVKNFSLTWLSTWWGITLLVMFFVACCIKQTRTACIYLAAAFLIIFGMQKMHINWGLRWYSVMYLLAFVAVYYSCLYWIKQKTLMLTENLLVTFMTFSIVGMIVGARTAYVFIYNFSYYKQHIWEIIATWEGGLSFHGGIVGVCISIVIFCRKYKVPFLHLMDKLARIVPLGVGMGRIGNFMNGELWGRPIASHVPWAIIFPDGGSVPRHPSQIYQSLAEGWGLFLTLFIISRWKQREGTIFACGIMFYSVYRFVIEYFRAADVQVNYFSLNTFNWTNLSTTNSAHWWLVLTMGQILCFIFFLVGVVLFIVTRKNILEGSPEWIKRIDVFYATHTNKD